MSYTAAAASRTCITVTPDDTEQGLKRVIECHRTPGTLHRAFSMLLFDCDGHLCLQQRSANKPCFPLCWSNTVCSHPRNTEETVAEWVRRRSVEEIGWEPHPESLRRVGKIHYRAKGGDGWEENELDWVYDVRVEQHRDEIVLNCDPDEIARTEWVSPETLNAWLKDNNRLMSPWFRAILAKCYDRTTFRPLADTDPDRIHHVGEFFSQSHGTFESDYAHIAPYSYVASMQGKDIRPMMTFSLIQSVGLNPEDAETIANTVQEIHNASLVADDIEDRSDLRRGAPCAHHVYGFPTAFNASTLAMLKTLQRLNQKDPKLHSRTLNTLVDLHRGQGTDIQWCETGYCPSLEDYFRMIGGKTGALFRLIPQLAEVFLGRTLWDMTCLYNDLSDFFQVRDDYCNICDPVYWTKKGFYEDLDEGKMSYSVIHCLRLSNASGEDRETLRRLLKCSDATNAWQRNHEKRLAFDILRNSGSLEATRCWLLEKEAGLRKRLHPTLVPVLDRLPVPSPASIEEVDRFLEKANDP